MRILHYSLGFPPFRSGGLTKYCTDLMLSQTERGHSVALLWPGEVNPVRRFAIKQHADVRKVGSFEVINPLPVPYDEGIRNVGPFLDVRDPKVYVDFFREWQPDIIHLHTIMGLPEALVDAAIDMGIRTVFTTHDYFPICPMVNLFNRGSRCAEEKSCKDCPQHNSNGLSVKKLALLQSPVYRRIKEVPAIGKLRAHHRRLAHQNQGNEPKGRRVVANVEDYRKLRARNIRILGKCSVIHANSSVAASIYRNYLPNSVIHTIPITHRGIQESVEITDVRSTGAIRIGYLGPPTDAKGYGLLIEALRGLWEEGFEFELHVYGSFQCTEPFLKLFP